MCTRMPYPYCYHRKALLWVRWCLHDGTIGLRDWLNACLCRFQVGWLLPLICRDCSSMIYLICESSDWCTSQAELLELVMHCYFDELEKKKVLFMETSTAARTKLQLVYSSLRDSSSHLPYWIFATFHDIIFVMNSNSNFSWNSHPCRVRSLSCPEEAPFIGIQWHVQIQCGPVEALEVYKPYYSQLDFNFILA